MIAQIAAGSVAVVRKSCSRFQGYWLLGCNYLRLALILSIPAPTFKTLALECSEYQAASHSVEQLVSQLVGQSILLFSLSDNWQVFPSKCTEFSWWSLAMSFGAFSGSRVVFFIVIFALCLVHRSVNFSVFAVQHSISPLGCCSN